jgi:hypothetical protein
MEFRRNGPDLQLKDFEVAAILNANTAGGSWQLIGYDNPNSPNTGLAKAAVGLFAGAVGEKMWRRSDGAIAWLRSKIFLRLELPIARQFEIEAKRRVEETRRSSVPNF